MTIWFLIVMSCASPSDPATCRHDSGPIMTFDSGMACRAVVMEAMRRAAEAGKEVAYACEQGVAM